MQVKYENRYEITNKLLNEFFHTFYFKKDFIIFIYIITIISLLINAVYFLIERSIFEDITFTITLCCISIIYTVASLIRIKNNKEIYLNRISTKCIRVTDKYEIMDGTEILYTYNFYPIKNIKETKNLIMLQMEPYKWLTFKKDGFTIGTYNEFRSFLKERYPNYKIK